MNNNATSATNDFVDVGAYYESLILEAVAQADAPLHEALVRSSVYRTINDSYERALAQLVISGKLLYASGEYAMAPEKVEEFVELAEPETVECDTAEPEAVEVAAEEPEVVEPVAGESAAEELAPAAAVATGSAAVESEAAEPAAEEFEAFEAATPEAPASEAFGPMSLRADSTLEQLRVNERSWPTPVAVGVSYDKKPADGLSLMGYELPTESAEVAAEQQELAQVEHQEPAQSARPELTLSSEPQQLTISFSDGPEVEKVVEHEPAAEPELTFAGEAEEPAAVDELASLSTLAGIGSSAEAARGELKCPRYLSGWDNPRCVFNSDSQIALLDKLDVQDMFGLIRKLGQSDADEFSSVFDESMLRSHAFRLTPRYRTQIPTLCKLSGNSRFIFDMFGNLRRVKPGFEVDESACRQQVELLSTLYSNRGEPLSLWNLFIAQTVQRKLKWELGVRSLPKLVVLSASELRQKGLTTGEVHSIASSLSEWHAGPISLGVASEKVELARQAAVGGWYPEDNANLERVKIVNSASDAALSESLADSLSVYVPSFRVLFCMRLYERLELYQDVDACVAAVLAGLKEEHLVIDAAASSFERLGFGESRANSDINVLNTSSTCEHVNADRAIIAPIDTDRLEGSSSAQAGACEADSSNETGWYESKDLTLEQALGLAIDQDAVSFNGWFTDLAYQDRALMGYMLVEKNPFRWADRIGKPANYIEVRYDFLMEERPRFDIDVFGALFRVYKISEEVFCALTHAIQPAYLYMKRVYGQGIIPLKYAEIDRDLEPSVCRVVRAYLASVATENADDRVEEKAAPVGRTDAPTPMPAAGPGPAIEFTFESELFTESVPEPGLAFEPEPMVALEPEPAAAPEPAPVPAPQQPPKPFTSKIEDLTRKGPMSIEAWLALLPADDADLMRWIFSDKSLMDYPHKPGGLGQLRQRRADLLHNRPHLDEDQFAPLYRRYDLTEEAFCKITLASPMVFWYLKACGPSSKFSLRCAPDDDTLPQEWRDRATQLNRQPASDGPGALASAEEDNGSGPDRAPRKRSSGFFSLGKALRAFAESGAVKEYHSLKEIRSMYRRFLENSGCAHRDSVTLPDEDTRCLNALRGSCMFLAPRADKIRSYAVDSRLTSELRRVLRRAAKRNIECGVGLILRENQELCDLYDVRDEEELYEIIRSFVHADSISGLELGAIPLIRLGETNRKRQMLGVLSDTGTELSREELAQLYADTYCVSKVTVKNNYLRDMGEYLRNGRYSFVETDLTPEQQQFIKSMVTEDYVSLPYVAASFAAKFGVESSRLINDYTLDPLGLNISRDLIVKKGVDLRQSFAQLLWPRDSFSYGAPGFGDEVVNHPDFRLEISSLLCSLTFIECNRGSFVSVRHLEQSTGVRKLQLMTYAYAMYTQTEHGVPFTVASLRKQGFKHDLDAVFDEYGFDEAFYDGLIMYAIPGNQIRRTRFSGVCMFCRKEGTFSSADAVEYVVKQKGPIEVGDLIDAFRNEYGVVITAADIQRAVKDKGLFYNVDLDMVMPNKEANAAYLRELLDNNNQ